MKSVEEKTSKPRRGFARMSATADDIGSTAPDNDAGGGGGSDRPGGGGDGGGGSGADRPHGNGGGNGVGDGGGNGVGDEGGDNTGDAAARGDGRRKKSRIWDHFDIIPEEPKFVQCKHCDKKVCHSAH